jgi:cytochrome c553
MKQCIAAMLLLLSPLAAADEAAYARGQTLAQQCLGCHGETGIAPISTNPNLAGQNADYLQYALKAYRDGNRKGGLAFIMQANASSLSDSDIAALALYFSSQAGRNATGG